MMNKAAHIDLLYGPPMTVISDCLRGFIIAKPGHKLIGADFSAIEARVVAWLAGQDNVLDIFARGEDIYCYAATAIYGRTITKEDKNERQIGKVATLALGYGGGVGAFQNLAKGYGVTVEDARADEIKTAWREAHPRIVNYWYALERAAIRAVETPDVITAAGAANRQVKFRKKGSFLFCQLPSRRCLAYPYPRIIQKETPWGEMKPALEFMTVTISKAWDKADTYGGSLCENVTQAVARDLLAEAMIRAEANQYPIVMHVHDSLMTEVPEEFGSVEEFEKIVCENPTWAGGLPMAAEAWTGHRFKK